MKKITSIWGMIALNAYWIGLSFKWNALHPTEDWKPDEDGTVENCTNWCTAHLWIVPAKVDGTWKTGQGDLTIKQSFQNITGTLKNGSVVTPINGKLHGNQITFTAGSSQYTGNVNGNSMDGTSGGAKWTATRGK